MVAYVRAAVYLRQSLDRDGSGLAVARQRQDCLKLCAERGWEPVEYVDNDTSASNGKVRPAYTRMLADVAAGRGGTWPGSTPGRWSWSTSSTWRTGTGWRWPPSAGTRTCPRTTAGCSPGSR